MPPFRCKVIGFLLFLAIKAAIGKATWAMRPIEPAVLASASNFSNSELEFDSKVGLSKDSYSFEGQNSIAWVPSWTSPPEVASTMLAFAILAASQQPAKC